MQKGNILKCRWCDWYCLRFKGKKPQYTKLFLHTIEEHEEEVKAALGYAGESLCGYLDSIERDEERSFGYMLELS